MRHIQFQPAESHSVAVLVKSTAFKQQELQTNYVTPLNDLGVPSTEIIAFTLKYNDVGKAPAKFIKEYLNKLLPALDSLGVQYLYVTDSAYFKTLTKEGKAEPHYGYVLPCKYAGYEHMKVVLGLNYQALIYNPDLQAKLTMSLNKLASSIAGCTDVLGANIIHSAHYPSDLQSIAAALQALHAYPSLSCDIETTSLSFWEAEIETISFAWDQHNGIAFCVSRDNTEEDKTKISILLKTFFELYNGNVIWHNIGFDAKILIYKLWMKDLKDTSGLLNGITVMTKNFNDTKLIVYLATNSTAGNSLGLKAVAHEFAGDYGVL